MENRRTIFISIAVAIIAYSIFLVLKNDTTVNWINLYLQLLITFIAVFAAFWLDRWWEDHKEVKQFNSMIDLIKAELKNNFTCIDEDILASISFETFKSLTSNTIFIKYISKGSFNTLWRTYSSLRQFKYSREKNEPPKDRLMKLWFDDKIDVLPILAIVIKKIEAEKK